MGKRDTHQPLKQRLGQTSLAGALGHHDRPQLAVVAHKHLMDDAVELRGGYMGGGQTSVVRNVLLDGKHQHVSCATHA